MYAARSLLAVYKHKHHPLAEKPFVTPKDLSNETLITYPVELSRLDVFTHFLTPANCTVRQHKTIETTEIILQMVAAGRGVTALPKWLIDESKESDLLTCRYLGHRKAQDVLGFVDDFIALSQTHKP